LVKNQPIWSKTTVATGILRFHPAMLGTATSGRHDRKSHNGTNHHEANKASYE